MNNLEKNVKRWLKRKVKFTEALLVAFLITGGIGYAETREPEMKELVKIIQTDLANASFHNEEEMLNSAKEIYYSKLITENKAENNMIKSIELNNNFINENEKVTIKIRTSTKDVSKNNFILKELQTQIKEKNPRDLNELLNQSYYKNSSTTISEWSRTKEIEIIELIIEECDPLLGYLWPLGGLGLIAGTALLDRNKESKKPNEPEIPVIVPPIAEPKPPVVEPPVEPPIVDPPVEPPIEPPVIEPKPPVEPPIEPPVVESPKMPYIWENENELDGNQTKYDKNEELTGQTIVAMRAIGSHNIGEKTTVTTYDNFYVREGNIGTESLNGAEIINKGTLILEKDAVGMTAKISTEAWTEIYGNTESPTKAINEGVIIGNESDYAMTGIGNGTEIINNGDILGSFVETDRFNIGSILGNDLSGEFGGMIAYDGSTAINNGKIEISSPVDGSSHGYFALAASGADSLAINNGTINAFGSNDNFSYSFGGYANKGGTVINEGIIETQMYGMTAWHDGSTAINNNIITTNHGIRVAGNSLGINNGTINARNTGMIVGDGGLGGKNPPIFPDALAINKGTINMIGTTAYNTGMEAGGHSTAINDTTGVINLNGTSGIIGMWGAGTGGKIENKGIISLNGDKQIGMVVQDGGIAINEGIIDLTNATNSVGMVAKRVSDVSFYPDVAKIKNIGKIILGGGVETTDNTNVSYNTNKAFALYGDGEFDNSGTFSVNGAFDTARDIGGDGTGKFVVSGGLVEADSLKGNFYASGALAMGNYNNTQDTYRLFKTGDMYANIISNSAMYNAALTKDKTLDGYYGVEMTRKNFNEIIDNSSFATYLENNYTEEGSTKERLALYDALKLQSTDINLNRSANNLQGNTIYPAFAFQTLSNIRGINRDIKNEVLNRDLEYLEEIRFIGFGKYNNSDVKMGDRVENYTANLSKITLGADTSITDSTRLGILGTVGKSDYEFDSKDKRNEDVYQGNIIGTYEENGVIATISAFIGRSYGDIKRKLNVGSVQEEIKGDLDTGYYGADLGLQKRYEGDIFNITPRVELNVTQMNFKEVKEVGTYALDVDKVDSTSVESGIGFTIDTLFETDNNVRFIPSIKAMYYREFANPYKDLNAKITSVSDDSFKITGYNVDRNRGEFSAGLRVENDYININGGVEFIVDDKGQELRPFAGIGYNF